PQRARDYLIMVDTSASQAKGPLAAAQDLADRIIASADSRDRIALWTVNTPSATRNLTRGFHTAKSNVVQEAVASLKQELPVGDTDLKEGLQKAVASFERDPARHEVVVFLGDGMSVHNPMTPADRLRLGEEMVRNQVAFYPVPLGPRLDSAN